MISNLAKKIPFLQNSVRVFFPLAALLAILVPMWTVTTIVNGYPFQNEIFNLFRWHGYQMLFGFFYTLIMGFTLTAGAHWTKKTPVNGFPLLLLLLFWVIDQLALHIAPNAYYVIGTSFCLGILFFYLLFSTFKDYSKKWPFLIITSVLTLFKILILSSHLGIIRVQSYQIIESVYEFTLILLSTLAIIISSRVIPNFTKNYFKDDDNYSIPNWLEYSSNISIILLILNSLFLQIPFFNFYLFVSVGFIQIIKLFYYKFFKAIKHSIIGMLHLGLLTLSIGLILHGSSTYIEALSNTRASLHLLLTGGLSILALNIMIRATLGHTGRKIQASKTIKAMYFFIVLGMLIRFMIPVFYPDYFQKSLHHSMGHWTMAFLIYLIGYGHMCFKSRVDS